MIEKLVPHFQRANSGKHFATPVIMEGPSLVILRKEIKPFIGQTVRDAEGYAKIGLEDFPGQKLVWAKTWGKHFLMKVGKTVFKTHFLLWGSYMLNERKDRKSSLTLTFDNGEINFYSSSIKILDEPIAKLYDWRVDVMSRKWDAKYVESLVKAQPERLITDILLDQNVFAGVGNIIKNEVLFRLYLYPETKVKQLSEKEITDLVKDAHEYSHLFYRWKKKYVLRKHWRIYHKGKCVDCEGKLVAKKMGEGERYTYHCPKCQPKREL